MSRFCLLYIIAILAFIPLAQQTMAQKYRVTVADMAFLHQRRDSSLLSKRDSLRLQDSVSVNNKYDINQVLRFGQLGIENREPVAGEHRTQTVKDLFFKTDIQRIKESLLAIITNITKTRDYTRNAGHSQGPIDYPKDSLDVVFRIGGKSFETIEKTPFLNTSFEIELTNKTRFTKYYAIVCNWETDDNRHNEFKVIDGEKNAPIILVPEESIIIPSPFIIRDGYFKCRINIFGANSFFRINYDPKNNSIVTISDASLITESVERYFFYEAN